LEKIKKRVEYDDEIERSTPPDEAPEEEKGESPTMIHEQLPTSQGKVYATHATTGQPGVSEATQSSSSLEYAVTQVKSHKLFSISAAIILLGAISAIGYFAYFSENTKQINSIAVMPFVNETGNKDLEYLSDGMTETLISSLSQIPNLSVKARSTVFYYKDKEMSPKKIGEDLNVEAVLLGRVVQRGEDLKLSLELVDTRTLNALWSETYVRKLSNLVTLQSEIARNVSEKLKIKLSGKEENKVTKTYTDNTDAYQAYLKGRFQWSKRTPEGISKGIEYFNQAIELDPNYALAWSGLSDATYHSAQYGEKSIKDILPKAKAAARKAIELEPDLAEGHASLGLLNFVDWNFEEAEKQFKKAIELNPKYEATYVWYGGSLALLGRNAESIEVGRKAVELDPLNYISNAQLAWIIHFSGDAQGAIAQFKKAFEIKADVATHHEMLGLIYVQKGDSEKATRELNKAIELRGLDFRWTEQEVNALSGKKIPAPSSLTEKLERNGDNLTFAAIMYSMSGNKDKAFEWLEKMYREKTLSVLGLKVNPGYKNLHEDPRYKKMIKKIGFPE